MHSKEQRECHLSILLSISALPARPVTTRILIATPTAITHSPGYLPLLCNSVQGGEVAASGHFCGSTGGWLRLEDILDLSPNRTGGCAVQHESPDSALSIVGSHRASPLSPVGDLKVNGDACDHPSSLADHWWREKKLLLFLAAPSPMTRESRGLQRGDYAPRATDTCSKPHDALVHIH